MADFNGEAFNPTGAAYESGTIDPHPSKAQESAPSTGGGAAVTGLEYVPGLEYVQGVET